MDGKRSIGSSSYSGSGSGSGSTSSLACELFGSTNKTSSSYGLFSSVFAPPSLMGGRDSTRSDIFGVYKKQHESAGGFWNVQNQTADGISQCGPSRAHSFNKDGNGKSIYQGEKIDPCSLSSSLYYGGQDFCNHPRDSRNSGSSYNSYSKNGEDKSGTSPVDSRGDWWQGSLYY